MSSIGTIPESRTSLSDPLGESVLYVPTYLHSMGLEVLVLRGEMLLPGNAARILLYIKPQQLPSHFGFLVQETTRKEKESMRIEGGN